MTQIDVDDLPLFYFAFWNAPLNLPWMSDGLKNIHHLVTFSAVLALAEDPERSEMSFKELLPPAEEEAASWEVNRVSYNSPLEIVLALGAGSTVMLATANKLLKLWSDFTQLRRERARAGFEVEAYRQAKEMLLSNKPHLAQESEENEDVQNITTDALHALIALRRIQTLPDRPKL